MHKKKFKKGKDVNRLQLRLLKEFIDQRKTNEANEIYANIKKLDLSDDESNLADGYIYFFQKKYKKAQSLVEKIVTSDPRNIEIAKFLGEIYRGENNFFEAASVYNDLNKKFSGGYYDLLCEVLILDSHHADGMKACKKAQLEKPTNPYPLIYMGISSREKEGSKDTYRYFMDSLSVKQTEMARTCLAELYFIDRDYKSAIEHYKKALESSPQSLRALSGLGWAELQNKNNDAALQSFKKLCQMDHKYVAELRKAYKILTAQNSPEAKRFAENIQSCTQ